MKSLAPLIFLLAPLSAHEADSWEWTLESGYLWKFGSNTDITRGVDVVGKCGGREARR
jgi:hypothetical protein